MHSIEQRFWAKVQKTGGCWLWTGAPDSKGCGQIRRGGRKQLAHRLSWELRNGQIPEGVGGYHGTCALHRCDTPACVNPDHLFLGTQRDNVADMGTKGRDAKAVGEANGNAKLTGAQVLEIRLRQGQSQSALAREFGASQNRISSIRSGSSKHWAHVG